jgi:hypothetical protein
MATNSFGERLDAGISDVAGNRVGHFTSSQSIEIFTGDYEANRLDPSRRYEISIDRQNGPLAPLFKSSRGNPESVFSYPLDLAQSHDSDISHFMQFNMYEVQSPQMRDAARLSTILQEGALNEEDNTWAERLSDKQLTQIGGVSRHVEISPYRMNAGGWDTSFGYSRRATQKEVIQSRIDVLDVEDMARNTRTRTSNPTRTLRQKKYKSKDTCFLYMPNKINNLSLQSYDTPSLLFAAILGQSAKALGSGIGNIIDGELGAAASNLMTLVSSMGPVMMRKAIGALDSVASVVGLDTELEAAATQLLGQTINPRKELVYNAPELRTFEFSYEFYPRNVKESQMVEAIIKLFRFHSAPSLSDNGNFLVPPSIFEIKFYQRTSNSVNENPFLLKVRDSALTEVNVDFTPNGSFTAFGNGAPVAITLSLTFKELDINVKDDILEGY